MDLFKIARKMTEDSMVSIIKDKVPEEYIPAFEKAVNWDPKTKGWDYSVEKACRFVKKGTKPLTHGWREDELKENAEKYGLESDGVSAYLPENRDMAKLLRWCQDNLTGKDYHYLVGYLSGYPPNEIKDFVQTVK